MNTHDPFAAFGGERTIIKPKLGMGFPPQEATPQAQALSTPANSTQPKPDLVYQQIKAQTLSSYSNPLIQRCSALLRMGHVVSAWPQFSSLGDLAHTWNTALAQIDSTLTGDARPPHERLACKYLLCTYLDECAANTPWGGSGSWANHSLLRTQFNETWGGEKCFLLLRQLMQNPVENRAMLELMAWVLSLGFRGKYHIETDGTIALEELRKTLYRTLYPARAGKPLHPPCWQSMAPKANRVWQHVPLWLPVSAMLAGLLALFLTLYMPLNHRASNTFDALSSIRFPKPEFPSEVMAAPPVQLGLELPIQLQEDIRSGALTLKQQGNRSIIIFTGDGLFESGSATVKDSAMGLIERVSEAVAKHPGTLTITGYTDNQAIRSVRFPSNWQLSAERAQHVGNLMGPHLPNRAIATEGAGAAAPIASNDTPAGRARNRRVEVTLLHTNP
ncbi:MAG TPA: type VI secretion system protein TssL, long form [Limnobacter sp.]|nr:type VI secretion system protein TssL, long form [Limnobacter sp.]